MRGLGLRWKLVALVVIAVLPMGLLMGHLLGRDRALLARSARGGLLPVARMLAATHDGALNGAHAALERISADARVRSFEPGRCRAALLEFVKEKPVYAGLAVVDLRGTVICTSVDAPLSKSLADRAYIREAIRTGDFAVGGYQRGRLTGKGSLHVACPIRAGGRVVGAVAGPLHLSHLSGLVAEAGLPEGSILSVVDASGRILLRYPDAERWIGTRVAPPLSAARRASRDGTFEDDGPDGVARYSAYAPLRGPGEMNLIVGTPKAVVLADSDALLRRTLPGVAAALLAVLLGTALYAERRILRRVDALGEAARRFSDGDLDARVPLDGEGDEIARAGRTLNESSAKLQRLIVELTASRKRETQLEAAQKLESVGRLAGGVAHDFNNILTAMMGYTDFCLAGAEPGSRLRGDLEEIKKAGQRGGALTRQLLAFSRKQVLSPRSLDLNEVLRGVEKMLRRLVPEDVAIVMALAEGLEPVFADPGQLEQVVMNLVINARDAMPRGGRVRLETSRLERYVRLSVRDEGTGIAPEHLDRIFEPFFTTKEPGKGTGLGLSMVYGIVRQSSGFIDVETAPGAGTTFHIHLPPAAAPEVRAPQPAPAQAASGARGTILLVEDDASVRRFAVRVLAQAGHDVLEADGPAAALELARRRDRRIDLLVSDVVMPKMRGPELAEAIRETLPGLPAVFISGFAEEAVSAEGLRPGENFLEKPLTAEALTRFVSQALERSGRV